MKKKLLCFYLNFLSQQPQLSEIFPNDENDDERKFGPAINCFIVP